jgi:hypothetical protein
LRPARENVSETLFQKQAEHGDKILSEKTNWKKKKKGRAGGMAQMVE